MRTPESVYLDEGSGYLYVSQIDGQPGEKDGKGRISKLGLDGSVVTADWASGFNAPKGLRSFGGVLWVADIDEVIGIDIATANDNTHPKDYKGRPVMYHSTAGVDVARITRIRQLLDEPGKKFGVEYHERIQHDVYSLQAAKDKPVFQGWTSKDPEVERARQMIADWDDQLTLESVPGAIYVRWTDSASATHCPQMKTPGLATTCRDLCWPRPQSEQFSSRRMRSRLLQLRAPPAVDNLMHALKETYTIVIVTHNMQQAARVADKTAFFSVDRIDGAEPTGILVEFDLTPKIFTQPSDRRTEDYVTGRFG